MRPDAPEETARLESSHSETRSLDSHLEELQRALEAALRQGLPHGAVDLDHFRTCVAWSLSEQRQASKEGGTTSALVDEKILQRMTGGATEGESTVLSDFGWSLACEQRADWVGPNFERELAQACFEAVFTRECSATLALVRSRLPLLGDRAEEINDQAWANCFLCYWSPEASRRFRGQARIRTTVGTAALRLGRDELRTADQEEASGQEPGRRMPAEVESEELWSALEECLSLLPPVRRIVSAMLLKSGVTPGEIARSLDVGRPAVSNHLKKARPVLQECLTTKGFGLPGWDLS